MKRILSIVIIAAFIMTGCAKTAAEIPSPAEVYTLISEEVELPEMVLLPQDLLSDYYGIEPEQYNEALSYTSRSTDIPDEIVIIKAASENDAKVILERLNTRLAFKEKSAANYFAETLVSIKNGIVRQDGLTVSLLVSGDIDKITAIYDKLK